MIERFTRLTALVGGLLAGVMMLHIVADVTGRFLFRAPLPATFDITEYWWMPIVTVLPMALAELDGEHIRVNLAASRLTGGVRRRFDALAAVVVVMGAAALFYYSTVEALAKAEIGESAITARWLAVWPARLMVAAALLAFTLQAAVTLYRLVAGTGHVEHADAGELSYELQVTEIDEIEAEPASRRTGSIWPAVVTWVAVGVISGSLIFGDLDRSLAGSLVVLLSMLLLAVGVHIGLAMTIGSSIGLIAFGGSRIMEGQLETAVFTSTASWQLSVIPMFVLMGIVMYRGGLAEGTFNAARVWLSRVPGGLAVATNFAGAGLAASSGSSVGISYALGRIAIPQMMRSGYAPSLSMGTVAAAGTLGQLIPPSVLLVIYASIAQVAVGPQLLAAVVPGVLLALLFGVTIVGWALIRPQDAPAVRESASFGVKIKALRGVLPVFVVVLTVIGGMYGGVFTATEAGAAGALVAFILSIGLSIGRGESFRALAVFFKECLVQAAVGASAVFLLLIGVELLNRVMALSQVPQRLSELIVSAGLGKVGLLLVLIVVYVVLGTFLEPLAMMLLTVPLLIGPLEAVGVDLLWFGVFTVVMAEVAILSPPVGMMVFIVHRIAQSREVNLGRRMTLAAAYGGATPFMVAAVLMLVLMIFVPDIALWLPGSSAAD